MNTNNIRSMTQHIYDTNNIGSIAQYIYDRCFGTNNDWWENYCPFSENCVKKAGKKFLKELNTLGVETYGSIRCEQTDWYFRISTSDDLYDIYIDWWNRYIKVNSTGFTDGFTVDTDSE